MALPVPRFTFILLSFSRHRILTIVHSPSTHRCRPRLISFRSFVFACSQLNVDLSSISYVVHSIVLQRVRTGLSSLVSFSRLSFLVSRLPTLSLLSRFSVFVSFCLVSFSPSLARLLLCFSLSFRLFLSVSPSLVPLSSPSASRSFPSYPDPTLARASRFCSRFSVSPSLRLAISRP